MDTVSALKSAGKGNSPRTTFAGRVAGMFRTAFGSPPPKAAPAPDRLGGYRAATNEYHCGPNTEWRQLQVGDLVTVYEREHHLAQVLEFGPDGDDMMLSPLFDFHRKLVWSTGTRWWARFDQVRLIPPPPLSCCAPSSAETPVPLTPEYQRSWGHECEELYWLLRAAVSPFHSVRFGINAVFEEQDYEWREDNPHEVIAAVKCFYHDLSVDEQKKILNGWTPRPTRPSAGAMRTDCDGMPVRLAVSVEPKIGADGSCYAEWQIEESTQPADVIIYANTTKQAALDDIRDKLAWVDAHWPEICAADPHAVQGGAA